MALVQIHLYLPAESTPESHIKPVRSYIDNLVVQSLVYCAIMRNSAQRAPVIDTFLLEVTKKLSNEVK